jgi:hypothetical protein
MCNSPNPGVAFNFDVIHTLEARSNFMLDVITEHFRLDDVQVFKEIQAGIGSLRVILTNKGIAYEDLKWALIPSADKIERAFVFDWSRFQTNWFGREVMRLILPLLEKGSSRSVLVGDWTSKYRFRDLLHDSFGDVYDGEPLDEPRAFDSLYFVYMNNLTPAAVARIDRALSGHAAYLGSLDLTYMSVMKAMLSTMLVRAFVQHRSTILQSHEDDRPAEEDVDLLHYDFASIGFGNRSVPGWLYGWFLSYKIERPILASDDSDTRFSLNALTAVPQPIAECVVELEEQKLKHLQEAKAGSMNRASFEALTAEQIATQIREKVAMNYIYSLARATDGETLKFNIMFENAGKARITCALEYRPQDRRLRVITLY